MEIKIPRLPKVNFSNCCMVCEHFSKGGRDSCRCNKKGIFVLNEHCCDEDFTLDVKKSSKAIQTIVYKRNVKNLVKKFLGENKVIIPVDLEDFINSNKGAVKVRLRAWKYNHNLPDIIYVTAVPNGRKFLSEADNYNLVASIMNIVYDDFKFLTDKENLFYFFQYIAEVTTYIYEKYQ